jgi:hypothetical protein
MVWLLFLMGKQNVLLKSKIRLPILFSTILVLTSGCGTPFSLRLGTYNEFSPQRPAFIAISDPQIYARETLVNDRLNEKKLLEKLLRESSFIGKASDENDFRKKFTPQFKRDLTTLQSFIADLGLEFDPLGGKQVKRTDNLADLKGQKEEFEAKTELEKARQKYEKALLGEFEEDAPPVPDSSDGAGQPVQGADTPSQPNASQPIQQQSGAAQIPDPALTEIKGLVATFNKKLETLIDALKKDKITGSTTEPDPRDAFRDLLAYRSELRQSLAAINLDDLHDYAGNALYRLQFRASLMPGENKDKLGVARLTFERPRLSKAEIAKLYYTWLTHTTRRLNRNSLNSAGVDSVTADARVERLEVGGLFRVVKIFGPTENQGSLGGAQSIEENGERLLFQVGVHPDYYPVIYEATRQWREYGDSGYPAISLEKLRVDLSKNYGKTSIYLNKNGRPFLHGSNQEERARYDKRLKGYKSDLKSDMNFFTPGWQEKSNSPDLSDIAFVEACRRKFALDHLRSAIMGYTDNNEYSNQPNKDVSDAIRQLSAAINGELQFYYTHIAKKLTSKNPRYSFGFENTNQACVQIFKQHSVFDVKFVDDQLAAPTPFTSSLLHMKQISPPPPPGRYFDVGDYCAAGDYWCLATNRRNTSLRPGDGEPDGPQSRANVDQRTQEISTGDIKIKQNKFVKPQPRNGDAAQQDKASNFDVQGYAYAYTVQPLELSQRLSTSARNTNSMELALSAVATLKQLGTTAKLDTKYIRQSSGNIEALERTPIVVGFAEREAEIERDIQPRRRRIRANKLSEKLNDYQNPQVGWVFGPPLRIDGGEGTLNYVQVPTAYEVSADLSLPGWWPSVRARLETAWIGNWNSVGQPIRIDQRGQGYHLEKFNIRLPINQADLDALTNFVANQTIGQSAQFVSLDSVQPYVISACTDTVELLIRGANVWRSTEVYLGGIPADDVRVLPDMQGIAAKFDLNKLFSTRNKSKEGFSLNREYVDLSIQTRDGSIDTQLVIAGERWREGAFKQFCSSPQTFSSYSVNADGTLQLASISPGKIESCAGKASFAISLYGNDTSKIRKSSTKAYFNGEEGDVEAISNDVYIARFDGPFDKSKISQGELTLVTNLGFGRASVRVDACKADTKKKKPNFSFSLAKSHAIYNVTAAKKLTTSLLFMEKSGKTPPNTTRIGLRPAVKSYKGVLEQSDGSLVANVAAGKPQNVDFAINLASNAAFAAHVSNGRIYETKFVEYGSDGSSKASVIKGNIVLYTAGNEKAAITKDKQSTSYKEFDITLELPVNYQISFPKAQNATLNVKTNGGTPSFPFLATQKSLSGTTAVFTVKLKIVDPSKEADEIKVLTDYLSVPKNFIRLQFAFSGVLGDEVPEIVIKKSTSDTQNYLTLQK